jgi:hypothetical protein
MLTYADICWSPQVVKKAVADAMWSKEEGHRKEVEEGGGAGPPPLHLVAGYENGMIKVWGRRDVC